MMNKSSSKGFSFGLVSGVITTLGIIIGLDIGTNSKAIVILGVLTIGFADGLSDALGVHVSEESEKKSEKKIWRATIAAFLSKAFFAITFILPIITLELKTAMIASIIYGLSLIGLLSYFIGKERNKIMITIGEHIGLTIIVMIGTYLIGNLLKV
jgi:VIT1/CCC1 family predicted Fe2+/Mn2+ transporter